MGTRTGREKQISRWIYGSWCRVIFLISLRRAYRLQIWMRWNGYYLALYILVLVMISTRIEWMAMKRLEPGDTELIVTSGDKVANWRILKPWIASNKHCSELANNQNGPNSSLLTTCDIEYNSWSFARRIFSQSNKESWGFSTVYEWIAQAEVCTRCSWIGPV